MKIKSCSIAAIALAALITAWPGRVMAEEAGAAPSAETGYTEDGSGPASDGLQSGDGDTEKEKGGEKEEKSEGDDEHSQPEQAPAAGTASVSEEEAEDGGQDAEGAAVGTGGSEDREGSMQAEDSSEAVEKEERETKACTWEEASDGTVYYGDDDATVKGLVSIDGKTYLFDEDGHLSGEGWHTADGSRYMVSEDGSIVTSAWVEDEGRKVYLEKDGTPASGWTDINGKRFYLDGDGCPVSGIVKIGKTSYIISDDGSIKSGWNTVGGNTYYVRADGTFLTGWNAVGGLKYYFDGNGVKKTGLCTIDRKKYLLSKKGNPASGFTMYNGKFYYAKNDGRITTGHVKSGGTDYEFDSSGILKNTGWLKIDRGIYYINRNRSICKGWRILGGKKYCFDGGGKRLTGLNSIGGRTYYMDAGGVMQSSSWKTVSGSRYYLDRNGAAATGPRTINGKKYVFNDSGKLLTGVKEYGNIIYKSGADGIIDDTISASDIFTLSYRDMGILQTDRNCSTKEDRVKLSAAESDGNTGKWEIIRYGDGTCRIRNVYSGLYLSRFRDIYVETRSEKDTAGTLWRITTQGGVSKISPYDDSERGLYIRKNSADSQAYTGLSSSFLWKLDPVKITDLSDIRFFDKTKEKNRILTKAKNGEKGTYSVSCSRAESDSLNHTFYSMFAEIDNTWTVKWNANTGKAEIDMGKMSQLYRKKQFVNASYARALKECGVKKNMNDREKVIRINQYIYDNYNDAIGCNSMYDMFKHRSGSCVQHMMLFSYLCSKNGLDVRNVSLKSKAKGGIGHALNMVKVGGKWYYCDSMFNNGCIGTSSSSRTFLFMKDLGKAPGSAYLSYDLDRISTEKP